MSAAFVLATGKPPVAVPGVAEHRSTSVTQLGIHSCDGGDILAAKQRLPLIQLLNRLCPDWEVKNPIRPDDKKNSFGADDHGWQDHGTGEKGDQISFIERFWSLSCGDAIRRFIQLAEVEPSARAGNPTANKASTGLSVDWAACRLSSWSKSTSVS